MASNRTRSKAKQVLPHFLCLEDVSLPSNNTMNILFVLNFALQKKHGRQGHQTRKDAPSQDMLALTRRAISLGIRRASLDEAGR